LTAAGDELAPLIIAPFPVPADVRAIRFLGLIVHLLGKQISL
jgi:hypothetical protein